MSKKKKDWVIFLRKKLEFLYTERVLRMMVVLVLGIQIAMILLGIGLCIFHRCELEDVTNIIRLAIMLCFSIYLLRDFIPTVK